MKLARALVVSMVLLLVCFPAETAPLSTVTLGGRAYVDAASLAARLSARLERASERMYLRAPGHVVTFTRGWARVEVDGKAIVLELPVRVEGEQWLVPYAFVHQVMPLLEARAPAGPAVQPPTTPAPPKAQAQPAPAAPVRASSTQAPPAQAVEPPPASVTQPASAPAPRYRVIEAQAAPAGESRGSQTPKTSAPPAVRAEDAPRPLVAELRVIEAPRAGPPPLSVATAPKTPGAMTMMETPGVASVPSVSRAVEPARAAGPAVAVPKAVAPGATLEELRVRSYPTFTRVVLEMSASVHHRIEVITPKELRVRFTALGAGPAAETPRDGLLEDVQLESAEGDAILRVTFAGTSQEPKISTLSDPPRVIFDFSRPAEPSPRASSGAPDALRTLVLDAGHGGHDSGAIGPAGLMEKDLVLDVTRRVAALVEANMPGIKVLLSRKSDYFVPLRERTSFANRQRADLFVSIHANAHREAASEGVETYFLSSEATDNASRQVAAAENSVVQLEKPQGRGGRSDMVKAILWDLAQSEFQQESSRLAEVVQDSMTQSLKIPNRGVKQAGFYVLGGAAMPAILVEIGFVTNPKEERKLKDSRYRDEIAHAIFAGIAGYKQDLDRRPTRAAAR